MPLAAVPAPANQRDDGLLAATLDAIAVVGPLPERRRTVVAFWLALASAPSSVVGSSAAPGSTIAGAAALVAAHDRYERRLLRNDDL